MPTPNNLHEYELGYQEGGGGGLFINDKGIIRKISGNGSGGGSSVQPDWNQNDENSPDYIKNKPFGEETVTLDIEWDGEITDDMTYVSIEGEALVHVSDYVFTNELEGMVVGAKGLIDGQELNVEFTIIPEAIIPYGTITIIPVAEADVLLAIVPSDNTPFADIIFPKAGIYFYKVTNDENYMYISSLKGSVNIVKKLDEKYLNTSATISLSYTYNEETGEFIDVVVNDSAFDDALQCYENGQSVFVELGNSFRHPAVVIVLRDPDMAIITTLGIFYTDLALMSDVGLTIPHPLLGYPPTMTKIPPMSSLPKVDMDDNGQILGVVDGAWSAMDAPSGLPEVTTDNNGDVLTVVDGTWTTGTVGIPEVNYPVTSVNGMTGDVTIDIPEVPTTLPNPNALTFSGAVEGIYDGSNAISIEIPVQKDITVNGVAADENGNIQIEVGSGDSSVQVDWSENDENANDYVKNRTHWEENEQVLIEWDGNTEGRDSFAHPFVSNVSYHKISDLTPTRDELLGAILKSSLQKVDGSEITDEEIIDGDNCTVIAEDLLFVVRELNCSYYLDDTEISFTAPSTGVYSMYLDFNEGEIIDYVDKLFYNSSTVHQLDEKFIPDTIARVSDAKSDWSQNDENSPGYIKNRTHYAYEEDTQIYSKENLGFSDNGEGAYLCLSEADFVFEIDKQYTIIWDGNTYNCITKNVNGGGLIGNAALLDNSLESSGEPFAMGVENSMFIIITKDTSATHNISISTIQTKYKKIPTEYLYQADWDQSNEASQDYVKNRPFYRYIKGKDVVYESRSTFELNGNIYVSTGIISPLDKKSSLVVGSSCTLNISNESSYTSECKDGSAFGVERYIGNLSLASSSLPDTGEKFLIIETTVPFEDINVIAVALEQSVYKYHFQEYGPELLIKVYGDRYAYKAIDWRYLPDTIVHFKDLHDYVDHDTFDYLVGDIENLQTTDKTNVVAAINELATPKTEFILNSSTEGSTKQFRITIDDNAKMTIEEIEV